MSLEKESPFLVRTKIKKKTTWREGVEGGGAKRPRPGGLEETDKKRQYESRWRLSDVCIEKNRNWNKKQCRESVGWEKNAKKKFDGPCQNASLESRSYKRLKWEKPGCCKGKATAIQEMRGELFEDAKLLNEEKVEEGLESPKPAGGKRTRRASEGWTSRVRGEGVCGGGK